MKRGLIWSAAAMLAVAAASCATPVASGPLTGSWGGQHVGLVLTADGGKLQYDCAAGRIEGPVILRADGSFRAVGVHTPAIGGPERVGEVRPSHFARYRGQVKGPDMTLAVDAQLPSGPVTMGPFSLRWGAEPRLLRCL